MRLDLRRLFQKGILNSKLRSVATYIYMYIYIYIYSTYIKSVCVVAYMFGLDCMET